MRRKNKRLENIIQLSKELKNVDDLIEILEYEIEENLFDNNLETYVNFIITKQQTLEPNKPKMMNSIMSMMMHGGDFDIDKPVDVTHVQYSESALIPEELALKMQMMVLRYYKKQRREIIKQLKEI